MTQTGGRLTRPWVVAIEAVVVLVVSGALAVIITWPVAINFSTHVVGGSGIPSDTMGYWWDVWNNHRNGLDLWGAAVHDQLGYPFGRPIVGSGNLLLLVFTGPAWVIASFASAAATLNSLVLAGIALTGASMYLLIRWLDWGRGVAAWAAIAFMLAPFVLFRATAHVALAHLEWAPLLLMAGIAWIARPTWWRALLLAAATLFGWLTNPYFGAMASVLTGVVLVVGLLVFLSRRRGWKAILATLGQALGWLLLIVAIPIGLAQRASSGVTEAVTRQWIELDLYGASPWDYIIPPPGTRFSEGLVGAGGIDAQRSPGGERLVFTGWLVMALALAGTVLVATTWRRLREKDRLAFVVALPAAIVLFYFSLAKPTRLWGWEIPVPSGLIFEHLPYLRAYARFGSAVLAALIVVAALGLALIVRNRSTLWRYCWVAGAIVFSAVEMPIAVPLGSGPPLLVDGKAPSDVPIWRWLAANRTGEPVIETPAFSKEDTDRIYMGGQTVHLHPLANGGLNEPSAAADFTDEFASPLFPGAPQAYATAGIPLVTIQPWAYAMRQMPSPDPTAPPAGLAVIRSFPDGSAVWEVTARGRVAVLFPDRTTWDAARSEQGSRWRYLRDGAIMRAYAPKAVRARIEFKARGYDPALTYGLAITAPDGRRRGFRVRGATTIAFTTDLPQGTSRFTISVVRPKGDPLGPGAMSVQTSQWTATRAG